MFGETTVSRVAITAAIATLAALVGLLTGRATSDEPAPSAAAPARPLAAEGTPEREPALRRELEQLAQTRAAELERLRRANSPAQQQSAGAAIAVAYRDAASVADEAAGLGALTAALRGAAAAWRRVAQAAGADERSAYNTARALVRRSEELLGRRLDVNLIADGS